MAPPVTQDRVVIVGSGLGGYTLARELRKLAPERPITMVTADDGAVYSKPMLSNALAQGKTPETLVQKPASQAAEDMALDMRAHSKVTSIDRAAQQISIQGADGAVVSLGYGALVLALGADPRPYKVAGSDAVPVASVNDLGDYRRWRESLAPGGRVLLIGGGLIGCEFANDLVTSGHHITLVDPAGWPLSRLLPDEMGGLFAEALTQAGIDVRCGRSVARLEADGAGAKAVLDDGSEVAFDRALSAIGLVPRTALAEAAGLDVANGIVVDSLLATSDPAITALGDCAKTSAGPLPFVLPLMAQARALAKTLAGQPTPLVLPAMPVVVKTPCLPIVVCPPKPGQDGQWHITGEGRDREAVFTGTDGASHGFALTGTACSRRQELAKTMPALLPA